MKKQFIPSCSITAEMTNRLVVIPGHIRQAKQVYPKILAYQGGMCRFCGRSLSFGDTIVGNGVSRKYYHEKCAKRIHII
jgi:hypothetical protein